MRLVLVADEAGDATVAERPERWTTTLRLAQHALFLLAMFALWEAVSTFVAWPVLDQQADAHREGAREMGHRSRVLASLLRAALIEVAYGFGLGVAGGVLAGFMLGEIPRLGRFLDPYLAALYGIPKTALAPLFILWFGIGLGAKVAMAGIMVFFLVFFNTAAGLRSVERDLINMARVAGASRGQILRKIKLPFAFPYIITGIKLGLPTGADRRDRRGVHLQQPGDRIRHRSRQHVLRYGQRLRGSDRARDDGARPERSAGAHRAVRASVATRDVLDRGRFGLQ